MGVIASVDAPATAPRSPMPGADAHETARCDAPTPASRALDTRVPDECGSATHLTETRVYGARPATGFVRATSLRESQPQAEEPGAFDAIALDTALSDAPMLEASEPPEARGLRRDDVRLMVSDVGRDTIRHAHFRELPDLLAEGDLLVVNTSGTLSAALPAETDAGGPLVLHLSTRLPGGLWVVELRQPGPVASLPYRGAWAGLTLRLPAGARATLLAPHPLVTDLQAPSRLWFAALTLPDLSLAVSPHPHPRAYLPEAERRYLDRHGAPIRYSYVPQPWPAAMYQTIFATEPGSAEMPSAARPFTPDLVTRLVARGVQIAPIVLHTGVASLEDHEPPYEEYYRVSPATADRVNAARRAGRRIVAVGTTVVRALETVTDAGGVTHPGDGWTDLIITPTRRLRVVDSLITGLHEPRATHLAILERVVGDGPPQHLARAYADARRARYLWHEFGDMHLMLGTARRSRR